MGKASKNSVEISRNAIKNCVALDISYLTRVTFEDNALRDELIGLFQAQLSALILKLPIINRAEEWRFSSHSLRGAAAAIGAEEIAALCATWEETGLPSHVQGRAACCDALQAAQARFSDALKALRP